MSQEEYALLLRNINQCVVRILEDRKMTSYRSVVDRVEALVGVLVRVHLR